MNSKKEIISHILKLHYLSIVNTEKQCSVGFKTGSILVT